MASRRFDLTIIGADAPGLAAAAIAAEANADVLLLRTGAEQPSGFSMASVPNAVWRALDLHKSGYDVDVAATATTLVRDNEFVRLYHTESANRKALEQVEGGASTIWPELIEDCRGLRRNGKSEISGPGITALLEKKGIEPSVLASANDVLDDYFHSEDLKTHLACEVLLKFGIAGDEPGSAAALVGLDRTTWPMRTKDSTVSLNDVLAECCASRSVERAEGVITGIDRNGRHYIVELETGEQFKTRNVMASSAEVALASGLLPKNGYWPLTRLGGGRGYVRITLDKSPGDNEMLNDGVLFIADSREEFAQARDAMREGRLIDTMPLMFEIRERSLVVAAPLCPAVIKDEEGEREWTGQDRQAFGRQVFDRIRKRAGLKCSAQSIDVRIDPLADATQEDTMAVLTPDPRQTAIAGATDLALEIVRGE